VIRAAVTVALLGAALWPGRALAVAETRVPVERLVPTPGGAGLWVTEDANVRGHLRLLLDLGWSVAGSQLSLEASEQSASGDRLDVVTQVAAFQLDGAVELWRQLRVGLALPILAPRGDGLEPLGGSSLPSAAVGDLRLHATVSLWPGSPPLFQMALASVLYLPTGDADSFAGLGTVGFEPRVLVTLHPLSVLTLRGQVGVWLHERRQLFGAAWGSRLTWAACVELGLPWSSLSILLRRLAVLVEADGSTCAGGCAAPVELRGGLRLRWARWHLSVGGGGGVTEAVTAPSWRALGTLGVVLR